MEKVRDVLKFILTWKKKPIGKFLELYLFRDRKVYKNSGGESSKKCVLKIKDVG
jgi:hypothetical protein